MIDGDGGGPFEVAVKGSAFELFGFFPSGNKGLPHPSRSGDPVSSGQLVDPGNEILLNGQANVLRGFAGFVVLCDFHN